MKPCRRREGDKPRAIAAARIPHILVLRRALGRERRAHSHYKRTRESTFDYKHVCSNLETRHICNTTQLAMILIAWMIASRLSKSWRAAPSRYTQPGLSRRRRGGRSPRPYRRPAARRSNLRSNPKMPQHIAEPGFWCQNMRVAI